MVPKGPMTHNSVSESLTWLHFARSGFHLVRHIYASPVRYSIHLTGTDFDIYFWWISRYMLVLNNCIANLPLGVLFFFCPNVLPTINSPNKQIEYHQSLTFCGLDEARLVLISRCQLVECLIFPSIQSLCPFFILSFLAGSTCVKACMLVHPLC